MFTKEQIQEARQQGLSLQEIAEKLKCSKSTVSKYCRGIKFDRTIIINKARESGKLACLKLHKKWQEKKKFVSEEAIKNWMIAKNDPLFMGFLG
jgi:transcriptional regulator with XRE-family HTH domain